MTRYVVLSRIIAGSVEDWRMLAELEAHSAESAIAKFAAGAEEGTRTFVALPASQWKPRSVEIKTETRVRVLDTDGDASPGGDPASPSE